MDAWKQEQGLTRRLSKLFVLPSGKKPCPMQVWKILARGSAARMPAAFLLSGLSVPASASWDGGIAGCFDSFQTAMETVCAINNPDSTSIPGYVYYRDKCVMTATPNFVVYAHRVTLSTGESVSFAYTSSLTQCEFIISLSGGIEVEPSTGSATKTLPFIAIVKNRSNGQPSTNPVNVRISLRVDPTSGGHDHGDGMRPRGGIAEKETCPTEDECWTKETDGNGAVVFNFNVPEVSGKYTITATCDGCTNNPQTAEVKVRVREAGVAGWASLSPSPSDYALVGGEEGKAHHDNHYLTATARRNLLAIIDEYNRQYSAGPLLHLNDASLIWGGKFDVDSNVPWLSVYPAGHPRAGNGTPHAEHRRGDVIDIRANQEDTAIPLGRFTKFEQIAARAGASAKLHCAFSGRYACPACELDLGFNRHYHVYLLRKNVK